MYNYAKTYKPRLKEMKMTEDTNKLSKLELFRKYAGKKKPRPKDPCIRAENEDDDGYDPFSDRKPEPEKLFTTDPWG